MANHKTEHFSAESPSYSSVRPSSPAANGDRAWRHKRTSPVARESVAGPYCLHQQRRCEWLERAPRVRKCGWFGDALLVQMVGALPRRCPECVDSLEPVPRRDFGPRV